MNKQPRFSPRADVARQRWLQLALATAFAATALAALPSRAELNIGNNPLYLVAAKANVLMVLDNSNSMDEDPSGAAAGSNNASSKSEIARGVIRGMTDTYRSRVNMGLMSYKLNTPSASYVHTSPYDASFNPLHYDPAWTGSRASATHKRYRSPNPSDPGNYIYYNVALPFYDGNNQGTAFCYSGTANSSNDFVDSNGWDAYRCFNTKTGTSNTLPTDGNSETANGWVNYVFGGRFSSTDSDYAQGITDFGRFISWTAVGRTWFRNDSPGRGYLHVPLGDLGSTQAATLKTKLACNVPGNPGACTGDGIQNAGLTPMEGTLLTALDYYNGGWNNASEGYTNNCYPLPVSCGKNFVVLLTDGLPSNDKNGNVVSNPATAIAAAAAAAAALKVKGIDTYIIGFALPYGTDPGTLNQIAVAGGTDAAYNASDSATLQAAFAQIFDDIFRKSSAFGSVSQNSTSINTGSLVFQGRFDSTDWSGEIVALQPQADGSLTTRWKTSENGRVPAAGSRKMWTLLPGAGGVEFKTLANLGTAQQAALASGSCGGNISAGNCAQARIDWIRGDQTREDPAGPLRRRSRVFGDVISSAPYYVKSTNTLFVGANDGMLHAIDATTGNERFTFIPNAVVGKLAALTNSNYSHDYYVDGEIAVSTNFETPNRSVLVGSLGRGGKALYALDVTTPASFGANHVMWEFTDPDLGLALGKPVIAKMNNGRAAVIIGNGYNSANERAVLFVIDLLNGTLIRKIDTQAGSSSATNGLATPRGWDLDGSGTVDILWAGDLLGNVWKFNLTSITPSDWSSSYTTAGAPSPLFVAKDASGTRQPITGMIGAGVDARKGDLNFGKRFIFFGSGRYLTSTDVSNTAAQSWYGLIDDDVAIAGRVDLKQRSVDVETTTADGPVRSFSVGVAGDMAGKRGWYIDLVSPTNGNTGERMVGEHKFFGTVLLSASMIPSTDACTPGGQGFLNAIDPFTGASVTNLFFDANNDLVFDSSDRIGSGRAIGSISPGINLPSDPILIGNRLVSSGTSGEIKSLSVNNPVRNGRISWREVVTK
jgi:type IV pilus assembly protein PilY1